MEVLSCHPNLVEMKDVVNARYSTSGICVDSVGKILLDEKQSLAARFRVLFILRNLKCDASVRYIARCFADSSALLKHELAYCLGQMCNPAAVPYLTAVLEDKTQEPIVRHEAAEALGAIGQNSSLAVLEKYVNDEEREVAETCQLAVNRIKWVSEKNASADDSAFDSIDPAPAYSATASTVATDVESLRNVLVDETLPLWDRYRAMFSLRNLYIDDERAVKALASGLKCAQSGALFRHEVAYVLGQIQSPASIEELAESLRDVDESPMVRHECAEALGSIATPECMNIVRSFASDDERIVRESCEVALDMAEYKQSNEFQYAKIE